MTGPAHPVSTAPPIPAPVGRRGRSRLAGSGVLVTAWLYVVVWLVGIGVWPSNVAIDAPASAVQVAYRADGTQAFVQYLLVEGVAGLLIGVVTLAAMGSAAARRPGVLRNPLAGAAAGTALLACAVSVLQWALGTSLIAAAGDGRTTRTGTLFDLVNRLDGIKMLLLALTAVLVVAAGGRRLPAWLTALGLATAVALGASGTDYLLLSGRGAWLVYVSGPLLLAWVAAVGTWLWRSAPGEDRRSGRTAVG